MVIDVFLNADAITPFPVTNAAQAIVGRAAVAMIADVVGQDIVTRVGEMLVLNHKVNFHRVKTTPRFAKVPWKTRTAHWQGVVENNQFIALAAFGRDVPRFKRRAVVGRDDQVLPAGHALVIGRFKDKAAQRAHDVGEAFDFLVVFGGNGFELFECFVHPFFGHSAHDETSFCVKKGCCFGNGLMSEKAHCASPFYGYCNHRSIVLHA